jgi:hypothetical protein
MQWAWANVARLCLLQGAGASLATMGAEGGNSAGTLLHTIAAGLGAVVPFGPQRNSAVDGAGLRVAALGHCERRTGAATELGLTTDAAFFLLLTSST